RAPVGVHLFVSCEPLLAGGVELGLFRVEKVGLVQNPEAGRLAVEEAKPLNHISIFVKTADDPELALDHSPAAALLAVGVAEKADQSGLRRRLKRHAQAPDFLRIQLRSLRSTAE